LAHFAPTGTQELNMSEASVHLRERWAKAVAPRPGTVARLVVTTGAGPCVFWCVPNPFIGNRLSFAWSERRWLLLLEGIEARSVTVESAFQEAMRPGNHPEIFAVLEAEWKGELERRFKQLDFSDMLDRAETGGER